MASTKPSSDQIRFVSKNTGEHILDTYMEAVEKGGRTLPDMLDDLFNDQGLPTINLELRYNPTTHYIEGRLGYYLEPDEAWENISDFTMLRDRGPFSETTAYNVLDICTHDNGILICRTSHTATTSTPDLTKFDWLFNPAGLNNLISDIEVRQQDVQANADQVTADKNITITERQAAESANSAAQSARDTTVIKRDETIVARNEVAQDKQDTQTARDLARDYANKAKDLEVEPGQLSAFHWSEVARLYAGAVTDNMIFRGVWDVSTNQAPPTPTGGTIDFYRVSGNGIIYGNPFSEGEAIVWDSTVLDWYALGKNETSDQALTTAQQALDATADFQTQLDNAGTYFQSEIDAANAEIDNIKRWGIDMNRYTKLVDTTDDENFIYIGEAVPGTATASASWKIQRVDKTNAPDLEIKFANGSSDYDQVWDNRTSHTYS